VRGANAFGLQALEATHRTKHERQLRDIASCGGENTSETKFFQGRMGQSTAWRRGLELWMQHVDAAGGEKVDVE